MELSQDFRELLELLNKNDVEYLVVGGYTEIMYGYPRLTVDIDIWVNPTRENSIKVRKTIEEFGFSFENFSHLDFSINDNVIQIGRPPYRVGIFNLYRGHGFY